MWTVTLRNLLARKVRLALSAFAVVLGVAFVTGSFVFTDSLGNAFDGIVGGTTADVEVMPHGAGDVDAFGIDARTIPASVVDRLRDLPGAKHVSATAQVQGVYVIDTDGKLVGGNGPPGLAFNYNDTTAITGDPILTLASGALPSGPDEVALDVDTARKAGYTLGDDVTLVTPGDPPTMHPRLVGLVEFGSKGGLVGATLSIFDVQALQDEFFGGRDVYTSVSMNTADGVTQAELAAAARQVLPSGIDARTGDAFAEQTKEGIAKYLDFINTFLLVFAGVAMVVGTFLIVNTFSILVAQRGRELALLRAVGASRRQVNLAVLAEAGAVGVFGSTAGIALGYVLALALKAMFAAVGLDIGKAGLEVQPRTVVISYAVGIAVTMLAALAPAIRAGRVPPIQVMNDNALAPERSLRRRLLAGTGLVVGGVVVMGLGLRLDGSTGLAFLGAGMLAILVGVSATTAVIGRPVVVGVGTAFRTATGVTGQLATQNSLRNPRRTAATASALMVGLTLVTLMSILGQSAKASTDKAIDESLTAELVVSNATGQFFSPAYAEEIRQVDGVASVTPVRLASADLDGSQIYVQATDPRAFGAAVQVTTVAGSTSALDAHSLLVAEATASDHHLTVGDPVELAFPAGPRSFSVAGIYDANGGPVTTSVVMTLRALEDAGIQPQDSLLYVTKDPAVSESSVRPAIEDILADNPTVTLKDQQEFADEQKAQINTFLYLIYALLGLAVVIAVLGITNTLALSVIERTREIGLLRAVGMSRRQLRSMVRMESAVIAVLGAVVGVVLGCVFGVVLQHAMVDQGIDALSIPWPSLAVSIVLAAVVGVLAAVFPARRAARQNILQAITTE